MNVIRNSREIQLVPIESVKPYERHARRHSKSKLEKLKKLLRHFGQVAPIIIDDDNVIIDGHALYAAMRELGASEIAAISIEGRGEADIKALRLALNRLTLEAAWDDESLRAELQDLVNLSFDLNLTGFDAPQIEHAIDVDDLNCSGADDEPEFFSVDKLAISAKGDIWLCGHHRVGCGDALDGAFVGSVLAGARADVGLADLPFDALAGLMSHHHRSRLGEFRHDGSAALPTEFAAFMVACLGVLKSACKPSALIFAYADWRYVFELLSAGRQRGLELMNLCVWAKTKTVTASLYRDSHELICVFKAETHAGGGTDLGSLCRARTRTNLWTYRELNFFGRKLPVGSHLAKPVMMIADVIRDSTKRRGIVLDTFIGCGSTLVAAEETGRICCGVEIDPLYLDNAIRRWQAKTGYDAVHAVTGALFNDRAQHLGQDAYNA